MSEIVVKNFEGIFPQIEEEFNQANTAYIAHDVDLSTYGIRPASEIVWLGAIPSSIKKLTKTLTNLHKDNDLDVMISSSNDYSFRFGNGVVLVNRTPNKYNDVLDEYYVGCTGVTISTVQLPTTLDVCKTDYRSYRVRYINDYGEYSDLYDCTDVVQVEIGTPVTLTINAVTKPTTGSWIIERGNATYQTFDKHGGVVNDSDFVAIAMHPVINTSFIDNIPLGAHIGALTHIDFTTIDEIPVTGGIVNEQGHAIVFYDNIIRVSYANQQYAYPNSGYLDIGEKIISLVDGKNFTLVFTESGQGILTNTQHKNDSRVTTSPRYAKTNIKFRCSSVHTISSVDNRVMYMSHAGLVLQTLDATVTPSYKIITHNFAHDKLLELDQSMLVGQAYEDGYYLTDGQKSYLISGYDGNVSTTKFMMRTTSVTSRVVTRDTDGHMLFVEGDGLYQTKFKAIKLPVDDVIQLTVYTYDDTYRVRRKLLSRPLSHTKEIRLPNSGLYNSLSINIEFSNGSIYETKIRMQGGVHNYGTLRIRRGFANDNYDNLSIVEIALLSNTNKLTAIKGT